MKRPKELLANGLVCCMVVSSALMSCTDIADDDHYKAPDWLKGNAWQVMEADGNHKSMLKAVELTGYRPIVEGQTILTVMAPDDAAWQKYLQELGYTSVDDMYQRDPKQLKKTVGYHLMYYAYDWQKMVNFRPNEGDGATEEQLNRNAGMYYKHRTRSQDDMELMRGKMNSVDTTVTVYHYERFLPVFSHKFFETKGIDAKNNYEYFYPHSTWTGGTNGFNVSNASVTDQNAVVTDNGYLYHVDQVVRPLETIYQQLKQNPNYSDFINLYDQYAEFTLASQQTIENVGYNVYQLSHGSLPPIAWEWPVSSYQQMATLSSAGYNIFAPSNQAIQRFFNDYWTAERGYATLADLDPLVLEYFIMQSFSDENAMVFPEEIRNEKVQTRFGTPININPDDVDDRMICANGVVYGMNHMEAPAIFSSVVGPAFADTTYQCYLYTLDRSGLVLSLASNKAEFVTLIPTNLQYNQNEPQMRLNNTSAGRLLEVYSDVDGNFATMGQSMAREIINMHTATNISELPTSGIKVVETNESFNYWFVRDGQITTSARFNDQLNPAYAGGTPFVPMHEIKINGQPWANGRAYGYDAEGLFTATSGDGLERRLALGNDKNYEYYLFAQLLQKAGLVTGNFLPSLASEGNRLVVFVPTNEAIRQNLADIPGCSSLTVSDDYSLSGTVSTANKTVLANYLRNYFVSSLMNTISSYPYPGSNCKGRFMSMTGEYVEIADNGGQLSFGMEGGEQIPVSQKYFCLPFAFSDGCMQLIDGILK